MRKGGAAGVPPARAQQHSSEHGRGGEPRQDPSDIYWKITGMEMPPTEIGYI